MQKQQLDPIKPDYLEIPRYQNFWVKTLIKVLSKIEFGQISLVLPNGTSHLITGTKHNEPKAIFRLRSAATARRLLVGGTIGLAESYMDGEWDSPSLVELLEIGARNENAIGSDIAGAILMRLINYMRHLARPNTKRGSRRNIQYHYDLGNTFYAPWLDSSMTYSSALFTDPAQSLSEAQNEKYRRLAESLALRSDHHVLEIGCGWGGFAAYAAQEIGCRVTALTISQEQFSFAKRRIKQLGLDDKVGIRLQDYRDIEGTYDRIASIEMFEAVGEQQWPLFFKIVRSRLKPNGKAALQIISIEDDRFDTYRRHPDFIQRYIFPGGMLPSPRVLRELIKDAGLNLQDEFTFGTSYAKTLALWQQRFQKSWPDLIGLGFDHRFKRMWEYYLAYCESGFNADAVDVGHYLLTRD
jgi:cyclopropane-fatty-acyl-phospholipid synthase